MVEAAHALETALDGLRKHTLPVTQSLIDLCLEATDALRSLRDEVIDGESRPVNIDDLDRRFKALISGEEVNTIEQAVDESSPNAVATSDFNQGMTISVEIEPNSIASAARAFQVMLALQELGNITYMNPTQEQIETSAPVNRLFVQFDTTHSVEEVRQAIEKISEIKSIDIEEASKETSSLTDDATPLEVENQDQLLGEFLIEKGHINRAQLDEALKRQQSQKEPKQLLGQILVSMGAISQETLDHAVVAQINRLKSALESEQAQLADRSQPRPSEKTIRTSVERLDNLMNLVGELITDRNRLFQLRSEFENRYRGDEQVDVLTETITHVGRITDQLQAEVMGIRMLPIANVFNKFPRLVRDLARKAGKQVELIIQGKETELDRSVIEEINDPLIHLLRNAVDHGIETPEERLMAGKPPVGIIKLSAYHEQGRIIITLEDDGRGIDPQKIRATAIKKGLLTEAEASALTDEEAIDLIFKPGFSTASQVTDVSGRGVGMDIVRTNIERLNGNVLVETKPGFGTQFQIILPLTLAIVPTLLVRANGAIYAIPIVMVSETLRIKISDIQTINARPVIMLRDHVLPVAHLTDLFSTKQSTNGRNSFGQEYVVVVRSGKSQLGLIVDALIGEQEVVVKSLSQMIGDVPGISSAAILGDGQVTLILEVQGLFKLALQNHPTHQPTS
jgi:two-component system chemotaxis sensor kinase CheA